MTGYKKCHFNSIISKRIKSFESRREKKCEQVIRREERFEEKLQKIKTENEKAERVKTL